MKRSVASRSIGRGLGKIEPAMSDTLIAFAAKAGAVASDGDGQNSPFATALVKYIAEPGLDLRLAFGRVRDDVLKSTANRQEPFVYGSLGGETMALVPAAAKPVDPEAQARVDYEFAAQVGTKEAWDSFLAGHATGYYRTSRGLRTTSSPPRSRPASRPTTRGATPRNRPRRRPSNCASSSKNRVRGRPPRSSRNYRSKPRRISKKPGDSLPNRPRRNLDEARRQVEIAQMQADAARQQVEDTKRQAIADAQRQVEQSKLAAKADAEKVASLTPSQVVQPPPPPAAPKMDQADITRLLQAHLKRVGCGGGEATGTWDDGSRKALDLFNKSAQTSFDVKLASLDALDAVRSKPDRVCPLICARGQRVDGDHCVQIGCSSGFFLNSSGACEKRPEPAPKPRAATAQREPAPTRRVTPSGGGGKCFSFNGKSYCE